LRPRREIAITTARVARYGKADMDGGEFLHQGQNKFYTPGSFFFCFPD
jgi:hypothetical protein